MCTCVTDRQADGRYHIACSAHMLSCAKIRVLSNTYHFKQFSPLSTTAAAEVLKYDTSIHIFDFTTWYADDAATTKISEVSLLKS